jgi:membrane protease YdiL (CAAX protease family)
VGSDPEGARGLALTGRLAAWATLVGVVSALAWAGNLSGSEPPRDVVYRYSTAASELALFGVIVSVVFWIARGLQKRYAFALKSPSSRGRALGLALAVFVVIAISAIAAEPLLHPGREQGLTPTTWEPAHAGAFALNLFALAIVGPIVEELTFRGLGFTLLRPYGEWFAIAAIGIAFGLWHGLLDGLPVFFIFGAGLAYLRSRTGSVYPGMVLHAVFNGLALLIAVTV